MHTNNKLSTTWHLIIKTRIACSNVYIKIGEYLQLISNYHTIVGKFKYIMNLPKLSYCVRQINIDKRSQVIALFLWEHDFDIVSFVILLRA